MAKWSGARALKTPELDTVRHRPDDSWTSPSPGRRGHAQTRFRAIAVASRIIVEGASRRGAILGAAPVALQPVALGGRSALADEYVAAFSAGHHAPVAGDHDRAGTARKSLLLRWVSRGNSDSKCNQQCGVEPPTLGRLGRGHAAGDPLRELLDRR